MNTDPVRKMKREMKMEVWRGKLGDGHTLTRNACGMCVRRGRGGRVGSGRGVSGVFGMGRRKNVEEGRDVGLGVGV